MGVTVTLDQDVLINGVDSSKSKLLLINVFIAGHNEATIELLGDGEIDTLRFEPLKKTIKALVIDRVPEKPAIIGSRLEVDSVIDLRNGKVKIVKGEIVLGELAKITNANSSNYIIQGDNVPVLFPVGSETSYTPCELTQVSGMGTNEYSISLSDTVYAEGNTGTAIAHMKLVKKTWFIETEATSFVAKIKLAWESVGCNCAYRSYDRWG